MEVCSRVPQPLQSGFVHFHNLTNPGFSRTFFALFPGVFQGYLKYTKQFPREIDRSLSVLYDAVNDFKWHFNTVYPKKCSDHIRYSKKTSIQSFFLDRVT